MSAATPDSAVGFTAAGLYAFQQLPEDMPDPAPAYTGELEFGEVSA
jgi:hypothetical protein